MPQRPEEIVMLYASRTAEWLLGHGIMVDRGSGLAQLRLPCLLAIYTIAYNELHNVN